MIIIGLAFFSLGVRKMNVKEVRQVISFDTIRTIFSCNLPYFSLLLSRITKFPLEGLQMGVREDSWLETAIKDPTKIVCCSVSSKATLRESVEAKCPATMWLLEYNKHLPKGIRTMNLYFGHSNDSSANEFVSKQVTKDDGGFHYDFVINLDYLFTIDLEEFNDPSSIYYLLHPFVCFDLDALEKKYEDDPLMLHVVGCLRKIKETSYSVEYDIED